MTYLVLAEKNEACDHDIYSIPYTRIMIQVGNLTSRETKQKCLKLAVYDRAVYQNNDFTVGNNSYMLPKKIPRRNSQNGPQIIQKLR